MNLRIIKYYIALLFIFFSWVSFASASVFINEVQVSPTGERFIELYSSDSSQSLTGWSIKRKSSSGIEYSLVSAGRLEGKSFSNSNYFLLVNEDDYIGSITPDAVWAKSNSFSNNNTILLFNSNGDLVSKVGYGEASDCDEICPSNPSTDKSLQRISSTNWIISSPTPGETNQNTDEEENDGGEDTTDDSTITTSIKDEPAILKITTKIISPKIVVARTPFSFNSLTTTNRGETYVVGKWIWNFGDGMISEVGESGPYEYLYEYPGEYALNLSYFNNSFSLTPEATDKIIIKVVESEVYISGVGNSEDPYIEIENKSKYEVNLSNWIVTAGTHYFKIPDGTILLPDKKIKLSPKITGFTSLDLGSIIITNPNKFVVATYPTQTKKLVSKKSEVTSVTKYNNSILPVDNLQNNSLQEDSQVINLNDLGASASGAKINISNTVYSLAGLLIIIGLGITSFLLIKKKNNISDYVEKEIRAEDMTIIE